MTAPLGARQHEGIFSVEGKCALCPMETDVLYEKDGKWVCAFCREDIPSRPHPVHGWNYRKEY